MVRERNELGEHLGVEIVGMTAADLVNREAADDCRAMLERHGVVVYRGAHLDDAQLLTLSRALGHVVVPPVTDSGDIPEVATITMDPAKSRLAAVRKGNFLWHIDGTHDEQPQKATLLTAWAVDPAGGDTEFATTYAAYDALPDDDKATIDDLRVVHRFSRPMRITFPGATPEQRAAWNRVPERVHPLVWRRKDGRRSLVIGATADEIVGWSENAGRALLDRLDGWATQPRFTYRHRWREGDLVVWDNTGMLHRALPFEPTSPRVLHRTTLVGEEPVTGRVA
ncbi:MAG TPA: TauD/TfdA family dioxygenase [Acidimicrobiia bacterium]|nr:TauD/TfdA family dioxygenase [Acidimicrobiia bacterium]